MIRRDVIGFSFNIHYVIGSSVNIFNLVVWYGILCNEIGFNINFGFTFLCDVIGSNIFNIIDCGLKIKKDVAKW